MIVSKREGFETCCAVNKVVLPCSNELVIKTQIQDIPVGFKYYVGLKTFTLILSPT